MENSIMERGGKGKKRQNPESRSGEPEVFFEVFLPKISAQF